MCVSWQLKCKFAAAFHTRSSVLHHLSLLACSATFLSSGATSRTSPARPIMCVRARVTALCACVRPVPFAAGQTAGLARLRVCAQGGAKPRAEGVREGLTSRFRISFWEFLKIQENVSRPYKATLVFGCTKNNNKKNSSLNAKWLFIG